MKISVMHSNLRQPFDQTLETCVELGLDGIHLSCYAEFDVRTTDTASRQATLKKIRSHGLEISAICVWGGEVELGEPDQHATAIPWGKQALEAAVELEAPIWMGHGGVMPWSTDDPHWQPFVDAAGELARHGEKVGACWAIETGPEPPRIVQRLIETIGSPAIRINYDPANLVLWPVILIQRGKLPESYSQEQAVADFEPVEGVKRLGPYIVHTHAKDALVTPEGQRQEVPLGTGFVDWPRYLKLLQEQGFDGYLAIERETGGDPVGDIRRASTFLREQLAQLG